MSWVVLQTEVQSDVQLLGAGTTLLGSAIDRSDQFEVAQAAQEAETAYEALVQAISELQVRMQPRSADPRSLAAAVDASYLYSVAFNNLAIYHFEFGDERESEQRADAMFFQALNVCAVLAQSELSSAVSAELPGLIAAIVSNSSYASTRLGAISEFGAAVAQLGPSLLGQSLQRS